MNIPKSWQVFNALKQEFEARAPDGATPHDFVNFLRTVQTELHGETVFQALARPDDLDERHLLNLAKGELSAILQ